MPRVESSILMNAPIDEVLRCEECNCVLIRTELPQSKPSTLASQDELKKYQ